ncbi:hypothetical protein PFISCL1PPCAC_12123, partial [Pristionchus fissidentatus]
RKVEEIKVHYPAKRPWINLFGNMMSTIFEYEDAIFLWEFDDPYDYSDEQRSSASCLHKGVMESDGLHWSNVDVTGEIPDFVTFSIYDSHESRFYMPGMTNGSIYVLDMKSLNWQRLETVMNEEVGFAFSQICILDACFASSTRKLHFFLLDHVVLDLDTKCWSVIRHPEIDICSLRTAFNVYDQVFIFNGVTNSTETALFRLDANSNFSIAV